MEIKQYSAEQIALAKKFLSPDAFLYIVCDALARGSGLSAVGFGDGERAVMLQEKASYLNDKKYLKEYGLLGADLKLVSERLYNAANEADWFCPLIHGIYLPAFDVIRLVKTREQYVERLFPYAWVYMGRVQELMKCAKQKSANKIAVVCRNSQSVAAKLADKYYSIVEPIEYSSWEDYDKALEQVNNSSANLVLCSVGQSGKYLIVEAAKSGKVVLDVGSAMINKWQ